MIQSRAPKNAHCSYSQHEKPSMKRTSSMSRSTRETIQLAHSAAKSGADFAIALPPGYYAGALVANYMLAIKNYFIKVAAESPIPGMIYNFPAVTSGIDMQSDLILSIAKSAPNICGIKLTCGAVGKLTRITSIVNEQSFATEYPRKVETAPFRVIDGFIDFLLPSMAAGSSGAITGLANFAPKTCVRFWELCQAVPGSGSYAEAQRVQNLIANADGVAIKIGGMKMLLNRLFGYGGEPRRPLMPMEKERGDLVMEEKYIKDLLEFERGLK
ncbi:hypothetical protein HYALB_00011061 [Hymenoscyphus albidus]|uniref:Uncharacterized protein n=1 Tax=Hymenoscyphus albidus TaxID=595503 RepID=A0A9N9Q9B1_9HELO|nr:hypothetical protein HYALB_00011061 [Hymenoscyphus albidus]